MIIFNRTDKSRMVILENRISFDASKPKEESFTRSVSINNDMYYNYSKSLVGGRKKHYWLHLHEWINFNKMIKYKFEK